MPLASIGSKCLPRAHPIPCPLHSSPFATGPAVRHDASHCAEAVGQRQRQGGRAAGDGALLRGAASLPALSLLSQLAQLRLASLRNQDLVWAPSCFSCLLRHRCWLSSPGQTPGVSTPPAPAVCGPHHGRAAQRLCLPQVQRARGGDAGGGELAGWRLSHSEVDRRLHRAPLAQVAAVGVRTLTALCACGLQLSFLPCRAPLYHTPAGHASPNFALCPTCALYPRRAQ